jgi:serine/threonine-protein kinase
MEANAQTSLDVMILPIEGDTTTGLKAGRPAPFVNGPFAEAGGSFSPDGRWLVYTSNESGRNEIYVRPFPAASGRWQVSIDGGRSGAWSPNDREIFYQAPDGRLMVASYSVQGGSFHRETPRPWCDTRLVVTNIGSRTFDLHPDGKRFAIIQPVAEPADARHRSVVLVQNFFDELRRLAPPK